MRLWVGVLSPRVSASGLGVGTSGFGFGELWALLGQRLGVVVSGSRFEVLG